MMTLFLTYELKVAVLIAVSSVGNGSVSATGGITSTVW